MLPGGEADESERELKRMLPGLKCGCCLKSSTKSNFSHFPPFPSVTFVVLVFAALCLHKHAYPHTHTHTDVLFYSSYFRKKKNEGDQANRHEWISLFICFIYYLVATYT